MATTFRLKNINNVIKSFDGRKLRMSQTFKLAQVISSMMFRDVDDHFRQESGPKRPWPKWSRRTKTGRVFFKSRPTKRGGTKLLQDTGRLKGGSRPFTSKTEVGIINRVKYAGFHQFGTKNMVARKFYWLSKRAFGMIADRVGRFINTGKK